jgi:hypothetical protein
VAKSDQIYQKFCKRLCKCVECLVEVATNFTHLKDKIENIKKEKNLSRKNKVIFLKKISLYCN